MHAKQSESTFLGPGMGGGPISGPQNNQARGDRRRAKIAHLGLNEQESRNWMLFLYQPIMGEEEELPFGTSFGDKDHVPVPRGLKKTQ